MKQVWKRILTAVLAFVLALSVLPQNLARADGTDTYGRVSTDKVYLRKGPGTSYDYWFRMNTNHVVKILGTTTKNGADWYKVETDHPNNNGRTYTGYVMQKYVVAMTADEVADWKSGVSTQPTAAPSTDTSGSTSSDSSSVGNLLGEINAGDVNFRKSAGLNGGLIMKLDRGTIVELLSIPDTIDSSHWFRIRYSGYEGYVQSPFIRILPESSSIAPGMTIYGYVKLTLSSANLRATPNGEKINTWRTKGEVLPYVSKPVSADGFIWYEVVYSGARYWVRSDCVQAVDSTGHGTSGSSSGTATAPTATPQPSTPSSGYIKTTAGDVNMRIQPFGESITKIKKGVILPYSRIVAPHASGNNSDYTWYFVDLEINGSKVSGYVRSDCATPCDANGNALGSTTVTAAPGATATAAPSTNASYLKTIKTGVNVRKTPGGASLEQLHLGTVVPVIGTPSNASSYVWYPIRTASGKTGYVRSDCVVVCDANGNQPGTSSGSTATPEPPTNTYGYVKITLDRTNIRDGIDGNKLFQIAKKGGVYPLWGLTQIKNNVTWYPIYINGQYGWVRGDCATVTDANGSTGSSGSNGSSGSTAASAYVITILDKVNLRASASKDSSALANVPLGTVMAYNMTTGSGSNLWYRVIYNNKSVWVLGTCVKIMTQAEYDNWLAQHPDDEPQTEVIQGYVKTTVNNVNIRNKANGDRTGKQIAKSGTVLPYTDTQVVRNYTWYYIKTSDGFRGWITGEFAVITDASGNTGSSGSSGGNGTYVPPTAGQEASYTTLKLNSTGEAVTNLVTELKLQGYYSGSITDTYTSAVEAAVKAFQKAKGLSQTGIADSATQHALFQTVPVGSGNTDENFPTYPVEKVDWFTGSINSEWAKGTSCKVYDVKTGIVWTAWRWSGGNHVDAEPLTAADTAKLCKIYGVSTAQQIADDNHWQGRPSVVNVGSHNYACSLMGMPHAPEDDKIPNNNFPGPLCIHFTNSRTHDSNVVRETHQQAIDYAYKNWKWGNK